jgi:arylsulfatase A-like enzyme/Tfp pilus assembly protein PilF
MLVEYLVPPELVSARQAVRLTHGADSHNLPNGWAIMLGVADRRMSTWHRTAAILVVLMAGGWFFWHRPAAPIVRHAACERCNVLLITIDTLRSDRVGAFGGSLGLTPTLDRLAAEGLRLTRAYSAAPLTLPSHTSILTAVSPPVHGVRANGLFRLGPKLPTLATVLKEAGYRTGAFVGAFVLDARFGLNRGFDVYDDRYGEKHPGDTESAERRAEDVIKPATAWINHQSNPQSAIPNPQWLAWVHLFDPHEPYQAPEPYASRHAPYDAEVAYTDAMIGRLIADLDAAHQLDRTLVVLVADHGESLGEHGERSHGVFAYDATLRVPWIVWAGARFGGQTWGGVSRLIDVAPTVLDLIGVASPSAFEGRSLVDAMAARETVAPPAYFEAMDANLTRNWAPLTGVISGHEKLIDLPIPELYDLDADPRETTNLVATSGERVRTLQSLLRAATTEFAGRGSASEKTTLSADARQRLQALGYTAANAEPGHRVYTDADDPKTLIAPAEALNRALADFKSGSREEATAAVRAIVHAHPGFSTAYGVLASMQRDAGDLAGAISTLEQIVRRGIADQSVMVVLGGYLQEAGALPQAAALLEAVVAAHADYADAHNSLGVVYSRLGRHDRAQAAFRKVLEMDPTSATAYENLGVDAAASANLAAAQDHLARALDLDPNLAPAHNALAAVFLRQGRRQEALEHWRRAIEIDPRGYDALYNLGTVLYAADRRTDARPYLERFVAEAPPARYRQDIARIRQMLSR